MKWFKPIQYVKARLGERSTWVGITLAIAAASALPYPWNILSCIAGSIGSFIPDGKVD